MQKPQFRNFLALCSAKIVVRCQLTVDRRSLCRKLSTINCQLSTKLCVIFFLIVSSISKTDAQVGKGAGNANFLDFNVKSYYFGITLGSNNSDYLVHRSKDFLPGANDSIAGVTSVQGPGLNLAIVSNLKLGDYFDIRFLPGFSFAERDVNYSAVRRGATIPSQKIESVFVELPFHVRYKSAPYNDKRFFEGPWMHVYKGKYYFSYSTGDTHNICYAMGNNPYGPFTYKGIILKPVDGWTNHESIVEIKGKWYIFYHDIQLSGKTHLRNVKVTELKYRKDGSIIPIDAYK